jgi:hypothetical protein
LEASLFDLLACGMHEMFPALVIFQSEHSINVTLNVFGSLKWLRPIPLVENYRMVESVWAGVIILEY